MPIYQVPQNTYPTWWPYKYITQISCCREHDWQCQESLRSTTENAMLPWPATNNWTQQQYGCMSILAGQGIPLMGNFGLRNLLNLSFLKTVLYPDSPQLLLFPFSLSLCHSSYPTLSTMFSTAHLIYMSVSAYNLSFSFIHSFILSPRKYWLIVWCATVGDELLGHKDE